MIGRADKSLVVHTTLYRPGTPIAANVAAPRVPPRDWRVSLPALTGPGVILRELRGADARSLFALLTTEEVVRFISPPPISVEGFETFIAWARTKRAAGQYVCFGIVPHGYDTAVGLVQIQMPSGGATEWGFALGAPFWSTGLFSASANAVLDFAFGHMGLEQLGARAAVVNDRGNSALRKLGAVREGLLPASFVRNGRLLDQYYWTLTPDDRPRRKIVWETPAH